MRYFPATTLKALSAAAAAVMVSTCGLVMTPFPKYGSTPFRVEGEYKPLASQATTHMVIFRQGNHLRVETTLPRVGRAAIVFDRGSNAAYALAPISAYAAIEPSVAPAAPGATPIPGPHSQAPLNIGAAGIAIRMSDADAPQPFEAPWAALGPANSQAIGGCRVAGEHGHRWQERAPEKGIEPRTACVTNDGIVLEMRQGTRTIFEATRLQRGPISTALFDVPTTYQRFDPQAVAASEAPASTTTLASVTPAS